MIDKWIELKKKGICVSESYQNSVDWINYLLMMKEYDRIQTNTKRNNLRRI